MGERLLSHLSPANASKYGVKPEGEGVIDGQHTLYLILDAERQSQGENLMPPFVQAGPIEVLAASPCEVVVEGGAAEVYNRRRGTPGARRAIRRRSRGCGLRRGKAFRPAQNGGSTEVGNERFGA